MVTGSRLLSQTESVISRLSGAAMFAILLPVLTILTFDLMAYLSSVAISSVIQSMPRPVSFADTKDESKSVGLVFKLDSPGAIKSIISKLSTFKLAPPQAGMWLKFTDEEH
ncbi:hypothetical protein OXX79_002475 [Metschnikowia pulcherrima]